MRFAVEAFPDILDELLPLWTRHHAEIADPNDRERIPLDPDLVTYNGLHAAGMLHIVTARDEAGALVGYHFSVCHGHIHYRSTVCSFSDMYWLAPEHRKGWAGIKLFREVERTLKSRGVSKMYSHCKLAHDMAPLFKRQGWRESERLFTKWVG